MKCIYCDRTKLTSEHIWGKWLIRTSGIAIRQNDKVNHSVSDYGKMHPHESTGGIFDDRNGTPLHAKRKLVCETCNNGWMSRIEADAKRVLKPSFTSGELKFTHTQEDRLAVWIALKTINLYESLRNQYTPKMPTLPESQEIKLGKVPESFSICIATNVQPWQWGWHHLNHGHAVDLNHNTARPFVGLAASIGPLAFWATNLLVAREKLEAYEKLFPRVFRVIHPRSARAGGKLDLSVKPVVWEKMLYDIVGRPPLFRGQYYGSAPAFKK